MISLSKITAFLLVTAKVNYSDGYKTPISFSDQRSFYQSKDKEYDIEIPSSPLGPPYPDGTKIKGAKMITIGEDELFSNDPSLSNQYRVDTSLLLPRKVQIWLPPTYTNSSKHRVLYMHDGQNAITDSNSWTGSSWRAAGALLRMNERNLLSTPVAADNKTDPLPILVLIPSASTDLIPGVRRRHLEYGDMTTIPQAKEHANFVALRLKPYIDDNFNTLKDKEHNFLIGTSLGGQASMNVLISYPELFGGVGALSPCFSPGILLRMIALSAAHSNILPEILKSVLRLDNSNTIVDRNILQNKKIYMDNGGDTDEIKVPMIDLLDHMTTNHFWNPGYWWLDSQLQPSTQIMKMILDTLHDSSDQNNSVSSSNDNENLRFRFEWKRFPGARHNERAWSQRIDKPLLFLLGKDKEK